MTGRESRTGAGVGPRSGLWSCTEGIEANPRMAAIGVPRCLPALTPDQDGQAARRRASPGSGAASAAAAVASCSFARAVSQLKPA